MAPDALPKILIVTPLLNGERFLVSCLKNVNRVFAGFIYQHVVVDAGSSDRSFALFCGEAIENAHWLSAPGTTIWQAVNWAIRDREFDVLYQLNVDDAVLPSIRPAIRKWWGESDAAATVLVGGCITVYLQDKRFRIKRVPETLRPSELLSVGAYIPQPAALIGAKVFQKIGFFSEAIRYAGDTEFWLRCEGHRIRFVACAELLALDRVHSTNLRFSATHGAEVGKLLKENRVSAYRRLVARFSYLERNIRGGLGELEFVRAMFSPQSDLLAALSFFFGNRWLKLTLPAANNAEIFLPKGRLK